MTYGLMKAQGKVISLLEGGYDLKALAVSSEAVLSTLFANDDIEFNSIISGIAGN